MIIEKDNNSTENICRAFLSPRVLSQAKEIYFRPGIFILKGDRWIKEFGDIYQ